MSQPIYVPTAKKMVHRRQKASPMPREPCCGGAGGGGGVCVGVRGAAGLKGERAGAGCLGDRKRETFSSRYSCPLSEPGGKAPS